MWREDGQELFFLKQDGTLMAARVSTAKDFDVSVPEALFPTGAVFNGYHRQFAVFKDGKQYLVIVPEQRTSSFPITVVVNWLVALQK
jgi:hypothetical protein